MKILIIGSNGFIGNTLYNFFSKENKAWGADVSENIYKQKYFHLERINTDYNTIFKTNDFDVCINASGNGSVPISLNKPLFDFELNVTNTIKLLEAIRLFNPYCKFINMSSAAVYGNPQTLPIKEDNELKPLSPYGWHKLYAEQICKEYFYLYNLKVLNLRLFSVYGEHLRKQLFWDIYQKTINSDEIELFGTGHETRDFIYIQDLVNAIDIVIKRALFTGEALNVASGYEVSIFEAASIFCKEINQNIALNFNQIVKLGDPLNWCADISLIKQYGFKPEFNLSDGLKNTVQWLKKNV